MLDAFRYNRFVEVAINEKSLKSFEFLPNTRSSEDGKTSVRNVLLLNARVSRYSAVIAMSVPDSYLILTSANMC